MRKRAITRVLSTLLAFTLLCGVADTAAAQERVLTPAEAVALGGSSDGARIAVRGEALGEVLRDGTSGSWLNVLGEGTAIGLWGESDLFGVVREFGDYHQRGQLVEAVGVYNAACDRHGGDRDVHVTAVRVVGPAEHIERPVRSWQFVSGAALLGLSAALWLWRRTHVEWSL